ncbi:hypothetical protein HK102_008219 [Quaeritorhiza haematococci]|nr:hypothetical protein HK102_008219 [Quaeritorhiza haematococci]
MDVLITGARDLARAGVKAVAFLGKAPEMVEGGEVVEVVERVFEGVGGERVRRYHMREGSEVRVGWDMNQSREGGAVNGTVANVTVSLVRGQEAFVGWENRSKALESCANVAVNATCLVYKAKNVAVGSFNATVPSDGYYYLVFSAEEAHFVGGSAKVDIISKTYALPSEKHAAGAEMGVGENSVPSCDATGTRACHFLLPHDKPVYILVVYESNMLASTAVDDVMVSYALRVRPAHEAQHHHHHSDDMSSPTAPTPTKPTPSGDQNPGKSFFDVTWPIWFTVILVILWFTCMSGLVIISILCICMQWWFGSLNLRGDADADADSSEDDGLPDGVRALRSFMERVRQQQQRRAAEQQAQQPEWMDPVPVYSQEPIDFPTGLPPPYADLEGEGDADKTPLIGAGNLEVVVEDEDAEMDEGIDSHEYRIVLEGADDEDLQDRVDRPLLVRGNEDDIVRESFEEVDF